jgi:hypothetical protein
MTFCRSHSSCASVSGTPRATENIDAFDSQTLDVVAQPFPTPGAQDNRQSPETPIGTVKMTSSPLLNRDG